MYVHVYLPIMSGVEPRTLKGEGQMIQLQQDRDPSYHLNAPLPRLGSEKKCWEQSVQQFDSAPHNSLPFWNQKPLKPAKLFQFPISFHFFLNFFSKTFFFIAFLFPSNPGHFADTYCRCKWLTGRE